MYTDFEFVWRRNARPLEIPIRLSLRIGFFGSLVENKIWGIFRIWFSNLDLRFINWVRTERNTIELWIRRKYVIRNRNYETIFKIQNANRIFA